MGCEARARPARSCGRSGIVILSVYGAVYFAATYLLGVEECAGPFAASFGFRR